MAIITNKLFFVNLHYDYNGKISIEDKGSIKITPLRDLIFLDPRNIEGVFREGVSRAIKGKSI